MLVRAAGLTTRAWICRVCGVPGGHGADVPDPGGGGRRCPGWAWPTRRSSPAGSGSVTCTPVAAFGPALVRVTVKVIVSPTLGVGLLTVLVSARSACCGVSVALAVLLPGVGVELVAVADRGRVGLGGRADDRGRRSSSVCGRAGRHRAHRPHAGDARRRCPGWAWPSTKVSPAGSRSVHPDARGGVGAAVGQRDGEGDDVADVGRRVADRLATAGRPAAASRWRWPCCCPVFGSNWSAWLTRRRVGLRRPGLTTRGGDRQGLRGAGGDRADRPEAGGRVVGPLAGTADDEGQARPAAGRSPARWWPRRGRRWSG